MEFLSRSSSTDAPLVAFGSSDGVIRVLSMLTWKVIYKHSAPLPVSLLCSLNEAVLSLQLVRRYTGGHKGSIACLMTFMSAAGEVSDCITVVFDACFAFLTPRGCLVHG
jgi:hypothetical protein